MNKIKLTIVTSMLLLGITSMAAIQIQMNRIPSPASSNIPHQETDNKEKVLLAFHDEKSDILKFTYSVPNTSFIYYIYDKDWCAMDCDTMTFNDKNTCDITTSSLPSGSYTIEVAIGSIIYDGVLHIK